MIDFTSTQLSWIVVTMTTVGGTGYLNMYQKIEELDKKLAVTINNTEHNMKTMEQLTVQLNRIEEKLTMNKGK